MFSGGIVDRLIYTSYNDPTYLNVWKTSGTFQTRANQWTGFYMIQTSVMKELNCIQNAIYNNHFLLTVDTGSVSMQGHLSNNQIFEVS